VRVGQSRPADNANASANVVRHSSKSGPHEGHPPLSQVPAIAADDAVHMLSTLLSIRDPRNVTSWTRAKRLGSRFLDDFSSTRSRSNAS
jgi:hypothetical protein